VVPNSLVGAITVINFTQPNEAYREEIALTLGFEVPVARATRVLSGGVRAALDGRGLLETPAPDVIVREVSALGTVYAVRFWTRADQIPPTRARDAVHRSVLDHLAKAGITPAYPKQDQFSAPMPTRQ